MTPPSSRDGYEDHSEDYSGDYSGDESDDPDEDAYYDGFGRPPNRPHPYTVEGYLLGMGDFASGAVAATGWRRTMAVVVSWAILIPMGIGVLVSIGRLIHLLLWR